METYQRIFFIERDLNNAKASQAKDNDIVGFNIYCHHLHLLNVL